MAFKFPDPEYQRLTRNRFNPCRVVISLCFHPGWLVPRDPGLKASIPLGLKSKGAAPIIFRYSTENVEEPSRQGMGRLKKFLKRIGDLIRLTFLGFVNLVYRHCGFQCR